jgi:hypothetical protein
MEDSFEMVLGPMHMGLEHLPRVTESANIREW